MERRIRRAAALLVEDERPIGDVASALGYADLFLFSRQFSAVMGVAPRVWRVRHRAS
jgi:AraC-like DNA-binding protein